MRNETIVDSLAIIVIGALTDYAQDFKPTVENNKKYFPEMPGLKPGQCPSCKEDKLKKSK